MPANAVMTSNQLPHSAAVVPPRPEMNPSGASIRPANSFNWGSEAAKVSR